MLTVRQTVKQLSKGGYKHDVKSFSELEPR